MPTWPPNDQALLDDYASTETPRRENMAAKYGVSRSYVERSVKAAAGRLGVPVPKRKKVQSTEWPLSDSELCNLATEIGSRSHEKIAARYGVSLETARSQISQARDRMNVGHVGGFRKISKPDPSDLIRMVEYLGKPEAIRVLGIAESTINNWISDARRKLAGHGSDRESDEEFIRRIRAEGKNLPVHVFREANC